MNVKTIRNAIRRYMPRKAVPIVRAVYSGIYIKLLCWYAGLKDRRYSKETGVTRLPPAHLRYRVHGSPDGRGFLDVGKKCSEQIETVLEKIGKDFDSFRNVLDFGCGCGRTLLWFADRPPSLMLYGTDIDAEAISWCRDHLDFAEFSVNESLPPLKYPSEMFDFVYAISVFTHLDENNQFRWLEELKRITSSGGIVLLTVHGRRFWKDLRREDVDDVQRTGFKFIASNRVVGIFPEWYQNAFHTRKYIYTWYPKYFDIVDYLPRAMGMQDVVVLKKTESDALQDGRNELERKNA